MQPDVVPELTLLGKELAGVVLIDWVASLQTVRWNYIKEKHVTLKCTTRKDLLDAIQCYMPSCAILAYVFLTVSSHGCDESKATTI